jgi:LysR family transcriptional activator of nhaA
VIADAPVPQGSSVRVYSHFLGETGVSFFAAKELAGSRRRGFPGSLDGAPFLLPLQHLTLRRSLNTWFERHDISPHIVAEFEDSALLKAFGADGVGIFAAPSIVEREVMSQYDVQVVGRTEEVKERFYAISAERRLKHPAVVAVSDAAKHRLFAR